MDIDDFYVGREMLRFDRFQIELCHQVINDRIAFTPADRRNVVPELRGEFDLPSCWRVEFYSPESPVNHIVNSGSSYGHRALLQIKAELHTECNLLRPHPRDVREFLHPCSKSSMNALNSLHLSRASRANTCDHPSGGFLKPGAPSCNRAWRTECGETPSASAMSAVVICWPRTFAAVRKSIRLSAGYIDKGLSADHITNSRVEEQGGCTGFPWQRMPDTSA